MERVFITNMSLQSPSDLGRVLYQPNGFVLEENRKTRFPIIPVIAENLKEEDPVKVIVLRTINEDTKDNLSFFYEELKELGISASQVEVIETKESQDRMTEVRMLLDLIHSIGSGSLVYMDITFGTKPMSALLLYAASFARKMKDVQIGGIYYGEIPRKKGKPMPGAECLYDMTYFIHLKDMIDDLEEIGCEDPENMLHILLEL